MEGGRRHEASSRRPRSSARLGRLRPPAKFGQVQNKFHLILVPSKLPRPRQRPARPQTSARLLRAVCAASNKHSIGSAQCVQPQTSTRLASRSVRSLKQVLDWLRAVCAASNKRSIGSAQCAQGVRDASQVCRVPGRLPRPRQRPARPQTSARLIGHHSQR